MLRLPATLIFVAVLSSAQSDPAGYILKASGAWTATLNGQNRSLKAGATVNPGDKLHSEPTDAVLGLVLYDGTYLKCGRQNPDAGSARCRQPIEIPARQQSQNIFSAFLDRLQNKHLPPVAFVTSRGAESGPPPVELREAVVSSAGSSLDLSSVLSKTAASELHLYLEPLDAPQGCADMLFAVRAGARSVPAGKLQPRCNGLYQLSATDASMQSAYPATILIVAPASQSRGSRMLSQAAERAAQWQSAGEDERRTYLRLTLGAIQQELRSSK
jgi:hypothetical protein